MTNTGYLVQIYIFFLLFDVKGPPIQTQNLNRKMHT